LLQELFRFLLDIFNTKYDESFFQDLDSSLNLALLTDITNYLNNLNVKLNQKINQTILQLASTNNSTLLVPYCQFS